MCLHSSLIPAERCTLCTPLPKPVIAPRVKREPVRVRSDKPIARDTDEFQHDDETSQRFDAMLSPTDGDCILFFGPGNHRQFNVHLKSGDDTLTTPARYAYSRAGRHATAQEVVKCTCGHTGENNGDGLCVNPAHLIAVHHSERSTIVEGVNS